MKQRIKTSKWKGARKIKMEFLLSFPKTEEGIRRFEAFWLGFKGGDAPEYGAEVKQSIRVEDELMEKSISGGSIKLSICPMCQQRISQHTNLRTAPDGADIVLGEKGFEYLKKCFGKWRAIPDELRRPFAAIEDMLESARPQKHEEIEASIIKARHANAAGGSA